MRFDDDFICWPGETAGDWFVTTCVEAECEWPPPLTITINGSPLFVRHRMSMQTDEERLVGKMTGRTAPRGAKYLLPGSLCVDDDEHACPGRAMTIDEIGATRGEFFDAANRQAPTRPSDSRCTRRGGALGEGVR